MSTAVANDVAMRFGGFHFGHGGGDGAFLFLMGLLVLGVVIWAVARAGNGHSARS